MNQASPRAKGSRPSFGSYLPILDWARRYDPRDFRGDLAAGLTVGAMLVPQAMAYALLAGLPPEVGLYAATVPVMVYAVFGTSKQLSVGPFALVSLLTASALAPIADEGTAAYLEAAALLALIVGVVHLVVGVSRLGFLANLLSHSVLVGFTAAAAILIAFSQVKHLLGISTASTDSFVDMVPEVFDNVADTHGPTLAVGLVALAALAGLKRWAPRLPASLLVVIGSVATSRAIDLESEGVAVAGNIPASLPSFSVPELSRSLVGDLFATALVISLVGFMGSIAMAKVYGRRHGDEIDPNQELIGIGAANVAAGVFGGYPVTAGMSRTAVNDAAGARTQLASIISAGVVLATIAFLTPLLAALPTAALGAIIIMAVLGLIDVAEIRNIVVVKRSDLIGLGMAFVGTLALGMELGIGLAVVASMLVVFARMSMPHSAVLGHVDNTTSYRNVNRFPEVTTYPGIRIVRVDAALSFVNATKVRNLLLSHAEALDAEPRALVLDASGINDLDATGAAMVYELLAELEKRGVELHVADAKGPVRDVLHRSGLWARLDDRLHTSTHDAVAAIVEARPSPVDQRRFGIDERHGSAPRADPTNDGGQNTERLT
jgi:sulfate permease, SulP family